MKKFLFILGAAVLGTLALGLFCKNSYVDRGIIGIREIEDIRTLDCNVNQIFTEEDVDLFLSDAEENFQDLSGDISIYVVKPKKSLRQYNFTMVQDVEVVSVIRGNAQENDTIQIVTNGGVYDQKYRYHEYENTNPVYYGMINILFPDNYYLFFAEPLETNVYSDVERYFGAFSLFSTFNLTSDESIPIDRPVAEIHYNDFGESEYLCDTEETLEKLLSFKRKIIGAIDISEKAKW